MIRAIERRIRRLEIELNRHIEIGPSLAEVIRERRRKRLLAEGKELPPDLPPLPRFDENGRRLTIAETIREQRRRRLG